MLNHLIIQFTLGILQVTFEVNNLLALSMHAIFEVLHFLFKVFDLIVTITYCFLQL